MNSIMHPLLSHILTLNAKTLAWIAEAPDSRWATTLVDDLAHWEQVGVTTPEQLDRYLLASEVYDLCKSYLGYRPNWTHLMSLSIAELEEDAARYRKWAREEQERWDEMERLELEAMAQEEAAHEAAIARAYAHSEFTLAPAFAGLGL